MGKACHQHAVHLLCSNEMHKCRTLPQPEIMRRTHVAVHPKPGRGAALAAPSGQLWLPALVHASPPTIMPAARSLACHSRGLQLPALAPLVAPQPRLTLRSSSFTSSFLASSMADLPSMSCGSVGWTGVQGVGLGSSGSGPDWAAQGCPAISSPTRQCSPGQSGAPCCRAMAPCMVCAACQ